MQTKLGVIVPGVQVFFQLVAQVVRCLVLDMAIRSQVEVDLISCRLLLLECQEERNPSRLGITNLAIDVRSFVSQVGDNQTTFVNFLEYASRYLIALPLLFVDSC